MSQTTIDAANMAERMNGARRAFSEMEGQMVEVIANLRKSELPVACRAYKDMNDAYEAMNDVRKKIFEHLESISRATIPEMLEEADVSNITLDYGDGLKYRFGKNQRLSVSMPDKEGGMAWLTGNGGEALIKPTVNAAQLTSFAKEFGKTTGKDLPVDFFKTSTLIYTSITKA